MMTKDYVPEKFRDCPQLFYDVLIRGEQKTRTKDVIDPSNDRLREAATVTYQSTLSAVDISAQLIRSQCVRPPPRRATAPQSLLRILPALLPPFLSRPRSFTICSLLL